VEAKSGKEVRLPVMYQKGIAKREGGES